MSGKLVFTADDQEMMLEASRREARGFARPQDIKDMLAHIRDGGTAVASMHKFNMGFSLPEGATIEFTGNCEQGTKARLQAEARDRSKLGMVKLRPHQEEMIKAVREMDPEELSKRLAGHGDRRMHPMPEIEIEQSRGRLHRKGQKPVDVVVLGEAHDFDKYHALKAQGQVGKTVKGVEPLPMNEAPMFRSRRQLSHSGERAPLQDLGRVPRRPQGPALYEKELPAYAAKKDRTKYEPVSENDIQQSMGRNLPRRGEPVTVDLSEPAPDIDDAVMMRTNGKAEVLPRPKNPFAEPVKFELNLDDHEPD
ncbi:hypothetical protein LCGC14_0044700 [marine sediment metagenome]|uniref:Uncharacterized protein n=2 Tax=root TaxID=1 RepID=A0A7V1BI41_9RHOB|nr:hypothetical protein [Sulfitobacter litoralis]HDZ53514.1 hypothetical protein [Sulfitobacter litoralis]